MRRRALLAVASAIACSGGTRSSPTGAQHDVARSGPSRYGFPLVDVEQKWRLVDAFGGRRFQNPTFALDPPPGDTWYVGGREGLVVSFRAASSAPARVFLDLRAHTLGWQDCGLLAMTFHPEFGRPGSPHRGDVYVFYNYTQAPHPGPKMPAQTHQNSARLSRFTVPDGADAVDRDSEVVLIEQQRSAIDHVGGGLFFGPSDGFLYLALGDGGHFITRAAENFVISKSRESQRIDGSLFSGVLRIDVDKRGGAISHPPTRQPVAGKTRDYYVPNDNPWVGVPEALEEFYAIGLRNPHRMAADPATGTIWVGDVGEDQVEEVDLVVKGGNYGWPFKEGSQTISPQPRPLIGRVVDPLYTYPNNGIAAIIGGFVYRGHRFAKELAGKYLFADNGKGQVWSLERTSQGTTVTELVRLAPEYWAYAGISSFATDVDGEPYVIVLGHNDRADGRVMRLARETGEQRIPASLSGTTLFEDLRALRPAAGLVDYTVNVPLWSNGADKQRWLGVPTGAHVAVAADGTWRFPAGAVFVKHFDIPRDDRAQSERVRIETRVLVVGPSGDVYGRAYRWTDDGADAVVVDSERKESLSVVVGEAGEERAELVVDAPEATREATSAMTGDFDLRARIDQADGTAGLVARSESSPAARRVEVRVAPTPTPTRSVILAAGDSGHAAQIAAKQVDAANAWVRLRRSGDRFVVYASHDGTRWTSLGETSQVLGRSVRVGPFVASSGTPARARFSGVARLRAVDHIYPGPHDCLTCHNAGAGGVLGATSAQLDRVETRNGTAANQLERLARAGMFATPPQVGAGPRLRSLDDASAPLETRVRSYLDVNCAFCHRPGSMAQLSMDLRFSSPLASQGLIHGERRWTALPTKIVTPGDPWRSILYFRLGMWRPMPPLGVATEDVAARRIIREWIGSLGGQPALPPPVVHVQSLAADVFEISVEYADPTATLYVTSDDTVPIETPGQRYTKPFRVPRWSVIRVRALRGGYVDSIARVVAN